MRLTCLTLPLIAGFLIAAPHCRADAWDDVLAGAGLTRATTRWHAEDVNLAGEGTFRLPLYDAIHESPLTGPFQARIMRTALLGSNTAGDLVMAGGFRMGAGTRRTLLGDPTADSAKKAKRPDALALAIADVWAAAGREQAAKERERVAAAAKSVPADVAEQAAYLLDVEIGALRWRNRAMEPVLRAGMTAKEAFDLAAGRTPQDDNGFQRAELLMNTLDLKRLMVGGEDLAIAADKAATALAAHKGTESFAFRAWTPLGWIILNGSANDTLDRSEPILLLLDTGGDDTYRGGGATYSENFPVSLLIDAKGNDRYINNPALDNTPVMGWAGRKTFTGAPSFGAGVLGYGILIDASGNDLYRSTGPTQGRGAFGMGLLMDRAGDDIYDCYSTGQGSADFGVGILADMAGTDKYLCFDYSQGYAGTKGFGLIMDRGDGNDAFMANDTVLDDPSGQTPKHNTSMAQGVGNGRRADFSEGHSLAGGVGVLLDEGGNNSLTCGVFGQGTGYWMGIGFCLLGPGNDTMNGSWYVQGSSAHFAIGIMDDLGGNDTYTATENMAQGAGHDWSVGWLIDHGGNDTHTAPNLSLGSGNATGMGFFWDMGGDDTYKVAPSITLGGAGGGIAPNSVRERNPTLGIFLDTGGTDTYPKDIPQAKNNADWHFVRSAAKDRGGERGSGLDMVVQNLTEPE